MIGFRKILEVIEMGLVELTEKVQELERQLAQVEEALGAAAPKKKARAKRKPATKKKIVRRGRPTKKKAAPKAKAKKAPRKETATGAVLNMIKRSRSGVSTTQIKKKTGFDDRKIWGIVNRLKKNGKIKSAKRGIYVKA